MSDSPVNIVHNVDLQRYELRSGDTVIGYTQYHPDGDVQLVFDHTEVDGAYSGRGLSGKLVHFALDDVRERGSFPSARSSTPTSRSTPSTRTSPTDRPGSPAPVAQRRARSATILSTTRTLST